jgi:tetratricopeptide (TPR) repeat protein
MTDQQPPIDTLKTFSITIAASELNKLYTDLDLGNESDQRMLLSRLQERYRGGGDRLELAWYNRDLRVTWSVAAPSPEAEQLNREALDKTRQKSFEAALALWRKAIEWSPRDPDLHYNMGLVYFESKEYTKGLDKCIETIRLCPIYSRAYFVLGSLYSKMRQFAQSERFLKEGLILQPANVMALVNLGAVYSIQKNYGEAIRAFEKSIAVSPKEVRSYLGLGKVYMAQGDMDNAGRCFKAVLKLDPEGKFAEIARKSLRMVTPEIPADTSGAPVSDENFEAICAEGFKAYIAGDYVTAVAFYQRYLAQRAAESDIWASLASCQIRLGQGDAAMDAIRNAIKYAPNKPALYKQAGIIFDACERDSEAGQYALKAIDLGKQDSVTLTLAGKSLLQTGKPQEGLRYLADAIKVNPNNLHARFYYAQALKSTGDLETARQNLEEILWSKVETPLKDRARREMQSLNS